MSRFNYSLMFAFLLLWACDSDDSINQPSVSDPQNLDEAIGNLFQPMVDNDTTVGVAVGIIERDSVYEYYFGERKKNSGMKVDENTGFEIASIAKTFAATILAKKVIDGDLRLDEAVDTYLPGIPNFPDYQGQKIAFVNLANHTSGLPRMAPNHFDYDEADMYDPYRHYTKERMYEFLDSYQLPRPVGEKEEYSNLGFGVLAHTLAEREGVSYETLLQRDILDPLAMDNTFISMAKEQVVLTDVHDFQGRPVPMWTVPDHMCGLAGIKTTLPDMLRYLRANMGLMENNPLKQAIQLAQTPTSSRHAPAHVGLAWIVWEQEDNTNIIWHNGGATGSAALLAFHKEKQIGVVMLFNTNVRGPYGANFVDMEKLEPLFDAVETF